MQRSQHRAADPSDADPAIVRAQLALGAGEVRWNRLLARGEKEDVLQRATSIIEESQARPRLFVGAGNP